MSLPLQDDSGVVANHVTACQSMYNTATVESRTKETSASTQRAENLTQTAVVCNEENYIQPSYRHCPQSTGVQTAPSATQKPSAEEMNDSVSWAAKGKERLLSIRYRLTRLHERWSCWIQ